MPLVPSTSTRIVSNTVVPVSEVVTRSQYDRVASHPVGTRTCWVSVSVTAAP